MRHLLLVSALCLLPMGASAGMLPPHAFDAANFLPPPPSAGSPEADAELTELHTIAARSTPDMLAAAAHDARDETPDIFNAAVGFDIATTPETERLLASVGAEEEDDTRAAKRYFHRPRPYAVDPALKTCTPVKPGGKADNSYPSGHATRAFAMGVILASLVPDRAQAILARAEDYAQNRLVCGMHFRSDIVAGQQFGTVLALRLMETEPFRARMEAARAELRMAGIDAAAPPQSSWNRKPTEK